MERLTMSKSEKQTIFEIYRACRLCGAGGGYRMPIVQNIVDIDSSEVELRQKIQDCLHLEVQPDDRMPPLICELCVDKVNDFYDFLKLTRQTNIRTRTRLGLPLQTAQKAKTEPDTNLGVTEPVSTEPIKKNKPGPKCSKEIKKEVEVIEVKNSPAARSRSNVTEDSKLYKILAGTHVEADPPSSERGSRESSVSSWSSRTRRSTPPRPIRGVRTGAPKNMQVIPEEIEVSKPGKRISNKELSDLLQDQVNHDDNPLLVPRSFKRMREIEPPRPLLIPKRAKIMPKELAKEPVKPVTRVPTKPLKEPPKPIKEPTKLVKEPTKLIKEPTKIVKEPTKLLKEPTKLLKEPTKLLKEPTKLLKEPTKLLKEPIKLPVNEPTPPLRNKPGPKSKKEPIIPEPLKILKSKAKVPVTLPKEETLPKTNWSCIVCMMQLKGPQGLGSHMKSHTPTFTKLQNACNPCGKWFTTVEEAAAHHRYHRSATFPYHCRRCFDDFRELRLYDEHIENNKCAANEAVPDVKCEKCWKQFPTRPLMQAHKCQGVEGRPGGECSKCQKFYATIRNLKKHESMCNHRRKRDLIADPDVLRRLKPMQVRISRCDDLLNTFGEYCDVSRVPPSYGLDKLYLYPYLRSNVKSKAVYSNKKKATRGPLKRKPERDSFIHWDSEDSENDNVMNNVDSLSILSIKKLFSKSMLGKVPRKKRRVKDETFDTIHDFGGLSNDINDIISSLGDDSNPYPNDLLGRRMSRNINEQLRISLNHIIGVPDDTNCDNVDMETENVSSVAINVKNEITEESDLGRENEVNIVINDVRSVTEKSVTKTKNEVSIENNDIGNESSKKSDTGTETEVSIENKDVRSESTENADQESENDLSVGNNEVRNESAEISDFGTETELSNKNNDVRDESSEKSDAETENEVSIENNDIRNEITEKSDAETENEVSIENNDVRNESTEKSNPESENEVSIQSNDVRNNTIGVLETETEVSNENNVVRGESSEKSDAETENEVSIENNDVRNESTEKSNPESENEVSIQSNDVRNNTIGVLETETEVSNENNVVREESTEKSDLETENDVNIENNDVRNESTEIRNLGSETEVINKNNDVTDESSEKNDPEMENEVDIEKNDIRNEVTERSDPDSENEVSIENNDVRNRSTEKSDLESENEVSIENNDVRNKSTEKSDPESENEVSNENNDVRNESTEESVLEKENEVVNENNDVRNNSTERNDLDTESNNENTINESSVNNDSATENVSAESNENHSENNDLGTESVFSKTGFSDKMDISNENDNQNSEHLTNTVAEESADNDSSNFNVECESVKELHNTNHSTNLPLIDIDSQDGLDFNDEKASIGTVGKTSSISDMEINNSDTQDLDSQDSLYFNEKTSSETVKKESSDVEINNSNINIDLENRREMMIDKNETLSRLDNEGINNFDSSKVSVKEVSLQNSVDTESEKTAVEENRINSHEIDNSEDSDPKIDHDCKDENIKKNPEDLNSVVHKESPIKHSIESLIGDTDKNPDKYIKEVISSLENIIMKNPRNKDETFDERANGEVDLNVDDIDDQNLMDALDEQIGEDKIDNDKITLEDLLPQEDRPMELDDISEDDFNFDA